jgi:hypothetical protein
MTVVVGALQGGGFNPSPVTVAEFVIELGTKQSSATWKVTFTGGRDMPAPIVPREHGKPPSQGLSAPMNVRPVGVGSLRVTPVAAAPPVLVTRIE